MRGVCDQAIADYTSAATLDPKFLEAFYNRGGTYFDIGEYGRAIADFTEVIAIDPKSADGYVARGNAYSRKGEVGKAQADFAAAKELGYTGRMP